MASKPSPDFDLITLRWAGNYLDGTPVTGRLLLSYNGGVMLDDGATPINIYPKQLAATLTTTNVIIDGASRQVGYAEFQVPASNDPDIQGSGGTYTLTEEFTGGRQGVSFEVDKDAPGGIIWLNQIIPTAPVEGEPISIVTYSDFAVLESRVDALELGGGGGGGGGTMDHSLLTNRSAADSHPQSAITGLTAALAAKQAQDADLDAIAALSPADNNVLQRKSGAWTSRTPTQLKADLAITKTDVGLSVVDNTSDAQKNSATATLTNKLIDGDNNTLQNIPQESVTALPDTLSGFALNGVAMCYLKWDGLAYPLRATSGTSDPNDVVMYIGGPGPTLGGTGATGACVGDLYLRQA